MPEGSSLPLRCNCRRKAETGLRCARCSVPICPDCTVSAPAGMICRECASVHRSRLFQVSLGSLAMAGLICLVASSLGGWLMLTVGIAFGFFGFVFAFLHGMGVAELALRITGRKRGARMEAMAGLCAGLGLLIGGLLKMGMMYVSLTQRAENAALSQSPHPSAFDLVAVLLWNPFFFLYVIISVFSAVNRIRYI